jgi:hypothetical protein
VGHRIFILFLVGLEQSGVSKQIILSARAALKFFMIGLSARKLFSPLGRTNMIKGIVSPDWKGLQMVSLERFEV